MTEAPEAMVPMAVQNELLEGRKLLESMEPQQRLAWGLEQFGETFALTTSFGIQSAVLLDAWNAEIVCFRARRQHQV